MASKLGKSRVHKRSRSRRRGARVARRLPKNSYASGQAGRVSTFGFSKKKRESWRKRLAEAWKASSMLQKYRSTGTGLAQLAGPFVNTSGTGDEAHMAMNYTEMLGGNAGNPNQFWTSTFTNTSFTPPVGGNSKVFIRGGRAEITFRNNTAVTALIHMWRVRTTKKGAMPSFGAPPGNYVGVSWDPTFLPEFQENYRVMKKFEFVIAPLDVYTVREKIQARVVNLDEQTAGYDKDYWFFGLTVNGTSTVAVSETSSWNLSFTGDNTV